jgi:hypothetical protein
MVACAAAKVIFAAVLTTLPAVKTKVPTRNSAFADTLRESSQACG